MYWKDFKGERQQAPELSGIHPGHLERYFFAAKIVSGNVLDAACGCGYGSQILQNSGSFVTGIDLEQEAIDYARLHYPGPEYITADVTKYKGSYNWVVCFENIEHLKDPLPALKNFRQSRGLLVSTPNEELYPFAKWRGFNDKYPHFRHYRPEELDELLKEAGWEVVERYAQQDKASPVTKGTYGKFLIYVCK